MTSKTIVRGLVWTSWIGSVILTKGAAAPALPFVEAYSEKAHNLLSSLIGNWISADLRSEDLDIDDLDTNGHLERLVALAIAGVIQNLPDHDPLAKEHPKTCHMLASALEEIWPTLNALNRPGAEAGSSTPGSWNDRSLGNLSVTEVHRRVLAFASQSDIETSVLTVDLWEKIIATAWPSASTGSLDPTLQTACATALHRELSHYLYEATKLAAEKFPAAHAAIQLRILSDQTDLLGQLYDQNDDLQGAMVQEFAAVDLRFSDLAEALASQTETLSQALSASLATNQRLAQLGNVTTDLKRGQEAQAKSLDRLINEHLPQIREQLGEIQGDTAAVRSATEDIQLNIAEINTRLAALKFPDLPPPRHVPKGAAQLFGRDEDVAEILAMLTEHRQIALTGFGGIGKTALMAALIEAFEGSAEGAGVRQGGIYFHDFYREPSLGAFVTSILQQASLQCSEVTEQPTYAALALRQPGALLWLEGAEKLDHLDPLLDLLSSDTWLIVTTRTASQVEERLPTFPVEPISPQAAAAAIHYYAAHSRRPKSAGPWPHGPDLEAWQWLGRDLGGHPLACKMAGDQCGKMGYAPEVLFERLTERGLETLAKGDSSKTNLHILMRQSVELVKELSPPPEAGSPSPALYAWLGLSLGGTNPTPWSILQQFGVADPDDLAPLIDLELAYSTTVPAAIDGETEPGYALHHALLAEEGRERLGEFGCPLELLLETAMEWGEASQSEVVANARVPGGPDRYQCVVPLAEALLRIVSRTLEADPERLHGFFYLPARMHELHANYLGPEPIYRSAVERMKLVAGEESSEVATALNNLASLLKATNRMDEAEPLMRRALKIDESSYGENHPYVAIHLNNLAQLLQATNRMDEAEPLMRRALKIDESSYGEDHPNVAIHLNNLAQLLKATNRMEEAEPLMRRALKIDESSYGEDHPNVARDLNNLAQLLKATNRMEEAEPLMRRALKIDESSYGKNHPEVATDLNNLAQLLQATNRMEEAEPLMRRLLIIFLKFLIRTGHPHPFLNAAIGNYAVFLHESGTPVDELIAHILEIGNEVGVPEPSMLELIQQVFSQE